MQLDDRVTKLEKKLARTNTVLFLVAVLSLGLLGGNLYLASRQSVSFDRIHISDSIEIGDQENGMTLDRSMLKIAGDELGEVLLAPGLLKIDQASLTGEELSLRSGPTQLIAGVSPDEGKLTIANQRGVFSVNLGGAQGGGSLSLLGSSDEAVVARVVDGEASIQVSDSTSTAELKP